MESANGTGASDDPVSASGGVAVAAIVATRNMCCMLAGRCNAIVAGAAVAKNLGMVDCHRRRIGYGAVAIPADVSGLDMRQTLACCRNTIVTGDAVADDAGVIE